MSKLLFVKANAKKEGISRTFRIADAFIEEYKKNNPQDEIITLDLYKTELGFLGTEGIMLKFNPGDGNNPLLKYARQFIEANKIVFAEPLWNLGIPAILKAYIDSIAVVGMTFKYTAQGPVGLCNGKKALNITSRGGDYSVAPLSIMEMGDKYMQTIMSFVGITDYKTISANALDVIGNDVEAIVEKAIVSAKELAKSF